MSFVLKIKTPERVLKATIYFLQVAVAIGSIMPRAPLAKGRTKWSPRQDIHWQKKKSQHQEKISVE